VIRTPFKLKAGINEFLKNKCDIKQEKKARRALDGI